MSITDGASLSIFLTEISAEASWPPKLTNVTVSFSLSVYVFWNVFRLAPTFSHPEGVLHSTIPVSMVTTTFSWVGAEVL